MEIKVFPVLRYFTWKLEFASYTFSMIVDNVNYIY